MRRKTSRIYPIGKEKFVEIVKDYSMKFGRNLYYVMPWPNDERSVVPLCKVPTFSEARQFVRDLCHD